MSPITPPSTRFSFGIPRWMAVVVIFLAAALGERVSAQTSDYGDHFFSSTSSASQAASTAIFIGTLPTDAEASDPSDANANADSLAGINDEDLTMPIFTVGTTTNLIIPVTLATAAISGSTARINVWVDWNGDGLVTGTGESQTVKSVTTNGLSSKTFAITPPIGTTPGTKFLRIRLTESSTSPAFSGASTKKGEVEDYAISVVASDYGDYSGFGSASSTVNSGLRLGSTVDDESLATTNSTATGDDTSGSDDEDGATLPTRVSQGESSMMTVNVTNTTGSVAHLNAWIDFNGNGILTDSGEQILKNQIVASGTNDSPQTINFTVPSNAYLGPVGVRLRLTSTANPGPTGDSGSGEVEDYILPIFIPCGYSSVVWLSTVSGSNTYLETYDIASGAKVTKGLTKDASNHALFDLAWSPNGKLYGIEAGANSSVFEVNSATGALTLIGSVSGSYNGMVFNRLGVPFISSLGSGDIYTFTLSALNTASTTPTTLVFDAPTNAPNGQILTSGGDLAWIGGDLYYAAVGGSSNFYLYKVIEGTTAVQLVGEFVTSTGSSITGVYGLIGDGYGALFAQAGSNLYEVNKSTAVGTLKYSSITANTIYGGSMPFDWCQMNDDHGDYSVFGLATSSIKTGLQIGNLNDGEYPLPVANNTATADDTTGFDDEDGVSFPSALTLGVASSMNVTVTNMTGSAAYLNAWIDFNGNGVLTDSNEQLASNQLIATGTNNASVTIPFTIPVTATAGTVGVRVWLSSVLSPGPTGVAGYGEIEDNLIQISAATTDYGDYPFFAAASQIASTDIKVGSSATDTESANPTTGNATADNSTGINDEDLTMPLFTVGNATTLSVPVAIGGTVVTARLNVFVDWNGDGDVLDASETQSVQSVTSSGSKSFSLTPPVGTVPGTKYLRIRFTEGSTAPTFAGASALRGEVEDYAITVNCTAIAITPGSMPSGQVATAYSQALGSSPLATYWEVTLGALPPLLTLNSSTGAITGTPTTAGTYNFTVTATITPSTANEQLKFTTYNLDINPSQTFNIRDYVVGASNANATIDWSKVTFTYTLGGANDPTVPADWNLPAFNNGDNVTVSAADSIAAGNSGQGEYRIYILRDGQAVFDDHMTIRVSSSVTSNLNTAKASPLPPKACFGTKAYSIVINPNPLDFGDWNGAGAQTSTTSSLVVSNLRLGALVDTELSVVPNATATADDQNGSPDEDGATLPVSITQNATVTIPVTVFNNTGSNAYLNAWIDFNNDGVFDDNLLINGGERLEAARTIVSGASTTIQNISFAVPSSASAGASRGVRFRLTNQISTPPVGAVGSGEVEDYVITLNRITLTPALANGFVGNSYTQTLIASGGIGPYTFSQLGGALPQGLTLNSSTGIISGVPTTSGSYTFSIKATDASTGYGTQAYTVIIGQITLTPTLPNGFVGNSYTQTVSANGGTGPYTFTQLSGTLPTGLSLSPSTGTISGTPTTTGSYTFALKATDQNGIIGTQDYTVVIGQITLTPTLPNGFVGNSYTQTVSANGGAGPYTFAQLSGTLPPGLSLNPSTGNISGTPTNTGSYTFVLKATDQNGIIGTQSYIVGVGQITLTPTLPSGLVGNSYTQTVSANGGAGPYTFAQLSGTLPPGLTLTPGTGNISGTPTTMGSYTFVLRATDQNGIIGTQSYTVGIGLNTDYGDWDGAGAQTTTTSSFVDTNIRLGAAVDSEASVTPNAAATADDLTGSDDEDGIASLPSLVQGQSASISINVTNTSSATAYLSAWIDFNNDGAFGNDSTETLYAQPVAMGNSGLNVTMNFLVPGTAVLGNRGLRVRISSDPAMTAVGAYGSGEVEDYIVTVSAPAPPAPLDYGDLPDTGSGTGVGNYQTLSTDNGPSHILTATTLRLGATADAETEGQPNVTATGDGADEDGIASFPAFIQGLSTNISVSVFNNTGSVAKLYGFIDWNGDGSFSPTIETLTAVDVPSSTSQQTLTLTALVPTGIANGSVGARFRLSSDSALTSVGPASNGEVEDYLVTITQLDDHGDYSLFADASASPTTSIRLGSTVTDAEAPGLGNTTATGDDGNGADDEDGAAVPTSFSIGVANSLTINVTNTSGAPAFLSAWIDFNNNHVLEVGEQIISNVSIVNGTNSQDETYVFNVPGSASSLASVGVRVRISSTSGTGPMGDGGLGEVEDYRVKLCPPKPCGVTTLIANP